MKRRTKHSTESEDDKQGRAEWVKEGWTQLCCSICQKVEREIWAFSGCGKTPEKLFQGLKPRPPKESD